MKVVWSYCNWKGVPGTSDIEKSSFQYTCLEASVQSWKLQHPSITRVLYVDQILFDFLKGKQILQFWDEVHIVDFQKEIVERYNTRFFAYPKMWAFTQQSEPFFICDTDVVLKNNVGFSWFDPTRYYGVPYSFTHDSKPTGLDLIKLETFKDLVPELRAICNWEKSVNGCLFYFPDSDIANRVGEIMLQVGTALDACPILTQFKHKWILYEEAIMRNIVEMLTGTEMLAIPNSWFKEYCGLDGNNEDYPQLVAEVNSELNAFESLL